MKQYVIWDLDGTLMDSLQDLYLAVNHTLRQYSMPERTLDEVRQFVGNGVRKLMERAIPDGEANPQFEACFSTFKNYYTQHCKDNTGLYPGMRETLLALHSEGIGMAIVSNKLQAGVDELYQEHFHETVDVAIGEREGISRKPAPDMVELALKELTALHPDVPATVHNSVYVGDSDVDVATARNSGLPCISVLWGFRDEQFLRSHGATTFAACPQDIPAMVLA